MLFNNSTSGMLTSDTGDLKIQDVTVFRTRWPGKSLERGRRCKRGKFKSVKICDAMGSISVRRFCEKTENGFLPKNSRITATLLGGRNYRRRRIFSALPGVCSTKFSISALGIREIFSKKKNSTECKADFPVDKRNIALPISHRPSSSALMELYVMEPKASVLS